MTSHLHRSFPEAGDGRPLPPMCDELMTAGLSAEDARFIAVQLAQNGLTLTPADALAAPGASADLLARLRTAWPDDPIADEAADALAAKDAEIAKLTAERDEALRRRDAWRTRAENHVEIVNALRAKTAGQDSRTLSRALLGAAFTEAETRAENAEAENARLREAYRLEAMRRPDYTHEAFDAHLAALTGEKGNE